MDIFKGYIKKLLVEQKDTYDEDNLRLTIDTLSKGMNKKKKLVSDSVTYFFHSSLPSACLLQVELFSWKTTSHKDHLEVCLPNSKLLSDFIGMLSSMKINLGYRKNNVNLLVHVLSKIK